MSRYPEMYSGEEQAAARLEKRKWKTEMERTLAFFDSVRCGPRFDSMSTFQAIAVWRAVASCGWQIFPDQLTDKQFELAKKGVVPSFAEVDGRVVPVEDRDPSRADEGCKECDVIRRFVDGINQMANEVIVGKTADGETSWKIAEAVVVSANKGFPEVWGLEPVAFDGQRRLVVVR